MKRLSISLACCAAFLACSPEDTESNGSSGGPAGASSSGSTTSGGAGSSGDGGAAEGDAVAQRLGYDLFDSVISTLLFNSNYRSRELAAAGGTSTDACLGWGVDPNAEYGQATFTFEANGSSYDFATTVDFAGCVALESGTHAPFAYATRDRSGDQVSETYLLNGTIAAVTFGEDGLAPAPDLYDASAAPTCADVVFTDVLLETPAWDATGTSNEATAFNEAGYSTGTLTARCGERRLHCNLAGARQPIGLLNLDAVAESAGRGSLCVFDPPED